MRALLLQAFFTCARSGVDGAARLQSAVPLVCRAVDRRPGWDATVFCKNRDRLLAATSRPNSSPRAEPAAGASSVERHFSVDGTLIEAWASMKSFVPKDGSHRRRGVIRGGSAMPSALPWREAQERHAFFDHRPRCPAVPQRRRRGSQALPHGTSDDGEPPRAHHRCTLDRGQRHRRAHHRSERRVLASSTVR